MVLLDGSAIIRSKDIPILCHDCRNTRPAENKEYWQKKCERNMKHDKDVTAMFEARGWKVLRIWECELKKRNETILVEKIQSILSRSSERTQR